jgi:hypothetical protein
VVSVLDVVVEELESVLLDSVDEPAVLGPAPLPCMLLLELVLPAAGVLLASVLVVPVCAIARPTPPARAAAAAKVVRLFLVAFISLLLDSELPRGERAATGGRLERKHAGECQLFFTLGPGTGLESGD